jgi:hypothetical protein
MTSCVQSSLVGAKNGRHTEYEPTALTTTPSLHNMVWRSKKGGSYE